MVQDVPSAPGLGWVDLIFECSTLCPILMRIWQKRQDSWARSLEHPNQSQPNPGPRADGTPCKGLRKISSSSRKIRFSFTQLDICEGSSFSANNPTRGDLAEGTEGELATREMRCGDGDEFTCQSETLSKQQKIRERSYKEAGV